MHKFDAGASALIKLGFALWWTFFATKPAYANYIPIHNMYINTYV